MVKCSICKEVGKHNRKTCSFKDVSSSEVDEYIETRRMIRSDFNNVLKYGSVDIRDHFKLYMLYHKQLYNCRIHEEYLKDRLTKFHCAIIYDNNINNIDRSIQSYKAVTKNLVNMRKKDYVRIKYLLRMVNKRITMEYYFILRDIMCNMKNTEHFIQNDTLLNYWINCHTTRHHLPIDCCRYIFGFLIPKH